MERQTDTPAGFNADADSFRPDVAAPLLPQVETAFAGPAPAPHPDDPAWGVFPAVGVWIGSVLLLLFLPLVPVVLYILARQVPLAQVGEFVQTDKTAILISLLAMVPVHVLTLLLAWAVVTGFGRRPFWRSLGWSWTPSFNLWKALGVAVGMFGFGLLVTAAFGDQETALERMLMSSRAARYAIVAMATLTAPLVEEVIYRGVLYSALQRAVGQASAVVGVFALFAAVHVPQYWPNLSAILAIILLSLVLTLVRARTGQLLPCVVVHLFFNGISSLLILLGPLFQRAAPPPTTPPTPVAPGALIDALLHLFGLGG